MVVFRPVHVEGHFYFVTAKISGGKNIFYKQKYCKIILDCLDWLRKEKRMRLFAFVVMPNHVHFIIEPLGKFTINEICHAFESFTAHKILSTIKKEPADKELLKFFTDNAVNLDDRKHKIWQNLLAKNIYSQKFLEQKFEYIHNNPTVKGYELAQERSDYQYSSACLYDRGDKSIIEIDDINDYLEP